MLVSINRAGTASGNDGSAFNALSAGGRFVVFESKASDLVATPKGNATACDGGPCSDIFVRDLRLGTTTLVNVNHAGTASGDNDSRFDAFSRDGRFVVFDSTASDLVATPKGNATGCGGVPCWDVFVRDLKLGTTTLVSVNGAGTASGDNESDFCSLSPGGRFVAFVSGAGDLVATPKGNATACAGHPCSDAFVRDLKLGTTTLVSINHAGTASGNAYSGCPVFNHTWRFAAFDSSASDLVITDTNSNPDVFVRDLKLGTTTLVTVNRAGTDSASSGGLTHAMSPNGRFVVFESFSNDLTAQTNYTNRQNLFVRDLRNATTTMISANHAGTASAEASSSFGAFSSRGRVVVFGGTASDLVPADTNGYPDVFVYDLTHGGTTLVSLNSSGIDSGNGISFFGQLNRYELDRSGRLVAFDSSSSNLVTIPDTNPGLQNVFVRDVRKGITSLVSVDSAGTDHGNGYSYSAGVSPSGRFVAFNSTAFNLVATPVTTAGDVFVRDLRRSTTALVSVNRFGSGGGDSSSWFGALTPNGRFVAFGSFATNLVDTPKGNATVCGGSPCADIFVRDLQ
jgi:Tol biopolymer transport system component